MKKTSFAKSYFKGPPKRQTKRNCDSIMESKLIFFLIWYYYWKTKTNEKFTHHFWDSEALMLFLYKNRTLVSVHIISQKYQSLPTKKQQKKYSNFMERSIVHTIPGTQKNIIMIQKIKKNKRNFCLAENDWKSVHFSHTHKKTKRNISLKPKSYSLVIIFILIQSLSNLEFHWNVHLT